MFYVPKKKTISVLSFPKTILLAIKHCWIECKLQEPQNKQGYELVFDYRWIVSYIVVLLTFFF